MTLPDLDGQRRGAADEPAASLILLLHGYGATAADLFDLSQPLAAALPRAAFLSVDAPDPCALTPMGRQWFPIPDMDGSTAAAAAAGLERSAAALDRLIDAEMAALDLAPRRLALVGFSQGAMMALQVGLRRRDALGAVVALSGRLLRPERLATEIASRPPVLLSHGSEDAVVPVDALHEARVALSAAEVPLIWRVQPGLPHGVDAATVEEVVAFLGPRLND